MLYDKLFKSILSIFLYYQPLIRRFTVEACSVLQISVSVSTFFNSVCFLFLVVFYWFRYYVKKMEVVEPFIVAEPVKVKKPVSEAKKRQLEGAPENKKLDYGKVS